MNWIKITPETELPEITCLYTDYEKDDDLFQWYEGTAFKMRDGNTKVITHVGRFYNPTHYCIITPPKD